MYPFLFRWNSGDDVTWLYNWAVYEIIVLIMYDVWAFTLIAWGLWYSFDLWAQVEKREVGYKEEGSGGEVVDVIEAGKLFALSQVVSLAIIVGAWNFAETTV